MDLIILIFLDFSREPVVRVGLPLVNSQNPEFKFNNKSKLVYYSLYNILYIYEVVINHFIVNN